MCDLWTNRCDTDISNNLNTDIENAAGIPSQRKRLNNDGIPAMCAYVVNNRYSSIPLTSQTESPESWSDMAKIVPRGLICLIRVIYVN